MRGRWSTAMVVGIGLLFFGATAARAISQAGGIVDWFDPSARGEALGGPHALAEGGPFAAWGNPAALVAANYSAVGYTQSQLARGLAPDLWIRHVGASHRFGAFGVGLLYGRLNQGEQVATDELGNIIGTFESIQTSKALGVGWSVLETLAPTTDPRHLRFLIGSSVMRIDDELAPGAFTSSASPVEATGYSVDFGARLELGFDVGADGAGVADHLTIGGAVTVDNLFEGEMDFGSNQVDPLAKWVHFGGMVRGEFFDHPNFGPVLRAEAMIERSVSTLSGDDTDIKKLGIELIAARMLSFRIAHYDDPRGDVVGSTVGVGLALDWTSLPMGIRADYASRPQATGLQRVDLWSVQVMKMF